MNRTGLERLLPLLAIAFVAAYYAFLPASLTFSRGVWVNDEGNRMLQIESFAGEGGGYLRDPLGGNILPGLAPFAPGGYMVREPEQHRIVSGYSDAFPFLVSPLFRLGGFPLCRVAVLLAGLACSAVVGCILRNASAGPRRTALGILLTGCATPLLFYSGTLLEITFAALLTSLTVLLIQTAWKNGTRILWIASGLSASLVPWFREEGYVAGAAMILSLPLFRRGKNGCAGLLFAAGFLPGTAALLLFNEHRYGTFFGLHHLIYREIQPASRTAGSILRSVWFFLFEPISKGKSGLFCAAVCPAILLIPILLFFWKKAPAYKILTAAALLTAAAAAVNAVVLWSAGDPLEMTLNAQSLCATVPFILFPVLFARRILTDPDPFRKFLLRSVLLASAGIAVLLEYNTRGMFFGPRHFVLLLPSFAVLAALGAEGISSSKVLCISFLSVCLLSAACQLRGALLLEERKDFGDDLNEICRKDPVPLIMTDVFFVPEELASLGGNPPVLWIQSEGIPPFRALADLNKLDRFLFLTGERFSSAPELIPALSKEWRFHELGCLEDPNMKILALNIYTVERVDKNHGKRADAVQPQ